MRPALAILLILVTSLCAADVQTGNFGAAAPAHTSKPKKAKRDSYPFSGELESHDAQTIRLKGKKKSRVLRISHDTRVQRNGATAKLAEAVSGERVSGSARKNANGEEEAVTINLKGPAAKEK